MRVRVSVLVQIERLMILISEWVVRISQFVCRLHPHGHDELLILEADRLYMVCCRCGWQSPGWMVAKHGKPTPAKVMRSSLTAVRKVKAA